MTLFFYALSSAEGSCFFNRLIIGQRGLRGRAGGEVCDEYHAPFTPTHPYAITARAAR